MVIAAAVAACGRTPTGPQVGRGFDDRAAQLHPLLPSGPPASLVAQAQVARVAAFRHPRSERPFVTFHNPGDLGVPRVFLVREVRGDWLRALLPTRPNGTEGWIRTHAVDIGITDWRVDVDLSAHRIQVWQGDLLFLQRDVATGTGGTPTPTGLFYITLLEKPSDTSGPYGPFAYGLSGFSDVLTTFAGGIGQIAIHGTNDPSTIGQSVSHGCVRVANATAAALRRLAPVGTPIAIIG